MFARRWLPCSALIALVSACAGAPPRAPLAAHFTSPTARPPAYPDAFYIGAAGHSATSAEQAAQEAEAAVSRQVSSQIQAQSTDWARAVDGRLSQDVIRSVQITSKFEFANLIRVVDAAQGPDGYDAFAVLDRSQADEAIARKAQADLATFESAAKAALEADRAGETGRFNAAAAQARARLPALEAHWLLRRGVKPSAAPQGEQEYRALRDSLLSALTSHRARQVVAVRVEGSAPRSLIGYAVHAVSGLGVRVAEGTRCTGAAQGTAELVLTPQEKCGDSSLGPLCEVSLQVHAQECGGGGEGEGAIPSARGLHPSDSARARKAAWAQVTEGAVDAAVREALKTALDLGDAGATPTSANAAEAR